MSYFCWLRSRTSYRARSNRALQRPAAPRSRPRLEALEERTLPSTYTAATVSDLIADINAANKAGGANTITLTAATTSPYVLTAVDNTTNGVNGLPVISGGGKKSAADNLTIVGNGDTIERATTIPFSGVPDFRLFDVAKGASLTLENLTLQNGSLFGEPNSAASAEGGAIYNQGTLVLSGVTVQGNSVVGGSVAASANNAKSNGANGADAFGGGIWSNGSLTLENGTLIQNNQAQGTPGGDAYSGSTTSQGGTGGDAFGGGVYIAGGTAYLAGVILSGNSAFGGRGGYGGSALASNGGNGGGAFGGGLAVALGTVTVTSATVENNTAQGGAGPNAYGGAAFGGGIDVAGGTVTLCSTTVQSNTAQGGAGLLGSLGSGGGGIHIAAAGTTSIDSFTVANIINNTDNSGTNGTTANIDGTYTLQSC